MLSWKSENIHCSTPKASEKKIGAMEATLRVAAERSGRSNARSARVVNPRRPPSASCSTSFGAGLVRHRRASMANYVITRALLKRIEADSTRAAQPEAVVHWIYQCQRPRFIRAAIEHLETRCTRASRARGHRANCVRRLWYCRPARLENFPHFRTPKSSIRHSQTRACGAERLRDRLKIVATPPK